MAELTEVAIEAAAQGAEEIAEQALGAAKVIRSLNGVRLGFASMGFVVGAATASLIAYRIAYKRLEAQFDDLLIEEIKKNKDHYEAKTEAAKERLDKQELEEVVSQLGYSSPSTKTPPTEPMYRNFIDVEGPPPFEVKENKEKHSGAPDVIVNVFEAAPTDVWDYAVEVKSRDAHVPYVVHKDEFDENVGEYRQISLTYFEDDDVLSEDDKVVEDPDEIVGVENLGKFGHGSNDPNVVYVRNDVIEVCYEIARSTGSYAEEVHGFEHADTSNRRRRPHWDG